MSIIAWVRPDDEERLDGRWNEGQHAHENLQFRFKLRLRSQEQHKQDLNVAHLCYNQARGWGVHATLLGVRVRVSGRCGLGLLVREAVWGTPIGLS